MSDRRRRYSFHQTTRPPPLIEDRAPQLYNNFSRPRRTIVVKTTIHHHRPERVERSPSPQKLQRRTGTSSPAVRTPDFDLMSPRDTPTTTATFVPLPAELPKMDEKTKQSSKDKPKVYNKGHKSSYSADTGYFSGNSSPRLEERSPDQYTSKPKLAQSSGDNTKYETIDGKTRQVKYITKDGKVVRYTSRSPGTRSDDEYVTSTAIVARTPDLYKTKYKETKKAHNELQKAFEDANETARFNYDAAKQEETARVVAENARLAADKRAADRIAKLEQELLNLSLEQAKLRSKAAESDRRLIEERQKREKREIEDELSARRRERSEEAKRRERDLEQRQWAEIEATPLSPRFKRAGTLPPLVTQEDKKATFRKSSDLTKSGYAVTPKPAANLNPTSVFMDPIFEAARDYDKKTQGLKEEDRQRTPGKTPRARRESQSFYK